MTRFHVVDVFARERYSGNQLAVVESGGDLDSEEMQAIAAEIDFSETTFVESRESPYRVRIFTPEAEIPFAGHPTLGTAAVVRDHVASGQPDRIVLDLDVGEIPVEAREGRAQRGPRDDRAATGRNREHEGTETLWMTQRPPEFGEQLSHDRLAEVLGLDSEAVDTDWPVQVVSTGLPTILVPLRDREALTGIELDRAAYDDIVADREAKLVHAFCADPREDDHDIAARMFAPHFGVPEDPATGSANGCLAGYLARHAYFGSGTVDARVEQGYEMGRPSLVHLSATDRGEDVDVEVGGSVVSVARGELV